MNSSNKILSASNIKYLLTLRELSENKSGIRCVEIADTLGYAKSSIHKMIKVLSDFGFVEKAHYGKVSFTEQGKRISEQYEEYFLISTKFFITYLGLMPEQAEKSSYAVLSEIPIKQLDKMCSIMKQSVKNKECKNI